MSDAIPPIGNRNDDDGFREISLGLICVIGSLLMLMLLDYAVYSPCKFVSESNPLRMIDTCDKWIQIWNSDKKARFAGEFYIRTSGFIVEGIGCLGKFLLQLTV